MQIGPIALLALGISIAVLIANTGWAILIFTMIGVILWGLGEVSPTVLGVTYTESWFSIAMFIIVAGVTHLIRSFLFSDYRKDFSDLWLNVTFQKLRGLIQREKGNYWKYFITVLSMWLIWVICGPIFFYFFEWLYTNNRFHGYFYFFIFLEFIPFGVYLLYHFFSVPEGQKLYITLKSFIYCLQIPFFHACLAIGYTVFYNTPWIVPPFTIERIPIVIAGGIYIVVMFFVIVLWVIYDIAFLGNVGKAVYGLDGLITETTVTGYIRVPTKDSDTVFFQK